MRSANFVEETTTSIAGTGGNGAVTLTAVTGRPRFSTVFGTQATDIRYVIEDTTNGKFEVGIGSVASNVLTRTRPQVTWDGTTYDDSTPSAYAFGSTPASGDVRVRLAATAESAAPIVPGVNTTLSTTDDFLRDYPITGSANGFPSGSSEVATASREYYSIYRLDVAGQLQGIGLDVVTSVASSSIKLALYPVKPNGLPGQKLLDFNTIPSATTGQKSDTATSTWTPAGPMWLTPGWYYIGWICEGAISLRGNGVNALALPRGPLGRQSSYGQGNTVYVAGNYASGLPAAPAPTAFVGSSNNLSVPYIGLKVIP